MGNMGNMRNKRTKRGKLKTKRKSFKRMKTKKRINKNTKRKIYYGGNSFWKTLGFGILLLGTISIILYSGFAAWTAGIFLSAFVSTAGKVLSEKFMTAQGEIESVDSLDIKDYMTAIWGTGFKKIIESLYDSSTVSATLHVSTVEQYVTNKTRPKIMKIKKDDWIQNNDLKNIFEQMRYSTPTPNEKLLEDNDELEGFLTGLQIRKLRDTSYTGKGRKRIVKLLHSIFVSDKSITESLNELVQLDNKLWTERYGEVKILEDDKITLTDEQRSELKNIPLMNYDSNSDNFAKSFHLLPLLYKIEPKSLEVDYSKKMDNAKVLEIKIDNEKNLLISIKTTTIFDYDTTFGKIDLKCGRYCKIKGLLERKLNENRKLGGVLFSDTRFKYAKKEVLRYCNKTPEKVGTLKYLLDECSSVDIENVQFDPPISGKFGEIPSLDWISSNPPHIRIFLRAISEYSKKCKIKENLYNMLNYTENDGEVELNPDIFSGKVKRFINGLKIKKESPEILETSKYKEKINRYLFEVSRFWYMFYRNDMDVYCKITDIIFS